MGGDGPTLVRNIFEYFRRSWLDGSFVDKSRRSSQEGPRSHLSSEARCAVNIAASRLCWRSSYVASRSVSFAGICAASCILQSVSWLLFQTRLAFAFVRVGAWASQVRGVLVVFLSVFTVRSETRIFHDASTAVQTVALSLNGMALRIVGTVPRGGLRLPE